MTATENGKARESEPTLDSEEVPMREARGRGSARFPVVGIGASAGGLAAFEAFLSGMPAGTESGMAFVLVQHLAPDHESLLSGLVRRHTRMRVYDVADGMKVEPDSVYIIPPNCDMAFLDGTLELLEPAAPRGLRLPIDFFFRSLAQDQRERAICIVLSGTGSDGTLGVRAVKGEGGMVMAQSPESAEYDGMPRSAIATGLVDYVVPPAEMPAQLMAYSARAFRTTSRPPPPLTPKADDAFKKALVLLRVQTGHDFSQYKENTITRRVERRMAVHQIGQPDAYVRYLRENPAEVEALFRDLLIGVTSFFRDLPAFEALEEQAIPRLLAGKPPDGSIRVWTPGCSTGEEAYSIAILLREAMETLKQSFKVQVFATDVDSKAIEQARAGVYPASVAADISPERLARFFVPEPGGEAYRVHKIIRDMLVFSEQDLIKDPPFSRLDLISCRNLMIYMSGELQKRLVPLFHYALNPDGLLFLGTSETVGEFGDLFATLDRQSKLYQRKEEARGSRRPPAGTLFHPLNEDRGITRPSSKPPGEAKVSRRELMERVLLQEYAPVGALVNALGDILYLHGHTGQYLEPAPGEPGLNILKMARDGLRSELTTALRNAVRHSERVRRPGLRVKTNGSFVTVHLTVRPVTAGPEVASEPTLFLVTLEQAPPVDEGRPEQAAGTGEGGAAGTDGGAESADHDARIAALKQELRTKEEYLQASNEELETSNEELKSSNEEMQSINEELQSTNEELETSKEELQSVNEELATVNAELQQKVTDLSRANNDMNNLLAGTGIGTIFVDHDQRIQRFTPDAAQVIHLIQADVGRPVGHIVSNLSNYDRLVEDVQAVMDSLIPREIEVRTKTDTWYSLRIRPYRTLENVIEGAVISFVDITETRRVREAQRENESLRHLAVVVRDSRDAITVQDLEGHILTWNPAAERIYGWSEAEALAMRVQDRIPQTKHPEEAARMARLARAELVEPCRTQRMAKDGRMVEVWLTASALVTAGGAVYAMASTEREISSQAPPAGAAMGREEEADDG